VPIQPAAVGVIAYVTVPFDKVGFNIVCTGITEVPLAVNPVKEAGTALATQVNVVPATLEVRFTGAVEPAEHIVCDKGVFVTDGFGLTVITCVIGVPTQLLAVGVMVIVTVPAVLLGLVNTHDGIVPEVPLAAAPVIPFVDTVVHA
jgi:hypothetical protein